MIHPVIGIGVVLQQHKNENLPPRERQSGEEQIGAGGPGKTELPVDVRFIRVKGDKRIFQEDRQSVRRPAVLLRE